MLLKLPVSASLTCPPAVSTPPEDTDDADDADDTAVADDTAGADDADDMDEVLDTTLACSVTCGDGLAEGVPPAGMSEVALADGTNHRAHNRVPAAVAVSNGRRADDTEYRSPCGAG
ncbi:hypothetical protein JL475_07630 [Streptomyces sp. M2CJ-2]|nr:hypothetical protein [Streptomyces sp. M2CJ-2]